MTAKQAEEFAARYSEIVTQFNGTETSFSATVFKEAVKTKQGQKYRVKSCNQAFPRLA